MSATHSQAGNSGMRRSVVLKRRPRGEPSSEDFEMREDPIPAPGPGEVVTRTIWLSIDPYMRGRLREEQTYAVAIQIGEVMTGETVGEVIASNHPGFVPGDIAVGARGWQSHGVTDGGKLMKIERGGAKLSAYLGVLGMPGATAFAGITEICQPKKGETVVISAASGAVGSVAGQLAKRAGARVVGVAGGPTSACGCRTRLASMPASITVPTICAPNCGRSARTGSMRILRTWAARCRRRCSICSIRSPAWRCAGWSRSTMNGCFRRVPILASSWVSAF